MFLVVLVCLCVCLQNNSESYEWIVSKVSENFDHDKRNMCVYFDGYSGYYLAKNFVEGS